MPRPNLLTLGLVTVLVSYAWAACPAAPSYGGPTVVCGESGPTTYGAGACATNNAYVDVNKLSAGDDCGRDISSDSVAVENYTWVLGAPPNCTYTVSYYFTASFSVGAFAETDNFLDCDWARGTGAAQINCEGSSTLKGVTATSTNGGYDEDSDSGTMTSPTCQQICVPNGALFQGAVGAAAGGQAISEARGGGGGDYGDPTFWHTETLCPGGPN